MVWFVSSPCVLPQCAYQRCSLLHAVVMLLAVLNSAAIDINSLNIAVETGLTKDLSLFLLFCVLSHSSSLIDKEE